MSVYKKKSDDPRTFQNESEFLKFYEKHPEEINDVNTKTLNLKYKIPNYKIGRKEGKIILYPVSEIIKEESKDTINILTDINNKLNMIINLLSQPDKTPKKEVSATSTGCGQPNFNSLGIRQFSLNDSVYK